MTRADLRSLVKEARKSRGRAARQVLGDWLEEQGKQRLRAMGVYWRAKWTRHLLRYGRSVMTTGVDLNLDTWLRGIAYLRGSR